MREPFQWGYYSFVELVNNRHLVKMAHKDSISAGAPTLGFQVTQCYNLITEEH